MGLNFGKYFKIVLAVYQIIGGSFGLYLIFTQSLSGWLSHFIIFIIILSLFVFSLISGLRLLFNKPNGYSLSLTNQYLQIIKIKVLGYGFEYYLGLPIYLGFTDTPKIRFFIESKFEFWSKAFIYIGDGNFEISLIINLIPIIIIYMINKYLKSNLINN